MYFDSIFTSEIGLEGHPDNMADQIGDAILDAYLKLDPHSKVGCNVMLAGNSVLIGGQIKSEARIDPEKIARNVIRDIGYDSKTSDFNFSDCSVIVEIDPQSSEISEFVNKGGAGDSAVIFGYACKDTDDLIPLTVQLSQNLAKNIDSCRKSGLISGIKPDGKVQVSVKYRNGKPEYVDSIVLSVLRDTKSSYNQIRSQLIEEVIYQEVKDPYLTNQTKIFINDTFTKGGPKVDCGLSGRKVIADTYGGWAHHGGGGLSGKDPSKIDRSASYGARYIAKNLVAAGISSTCEIQLAYVIGQDNPTGLSINLFDNSNIDKSYLFDLIYKIFPLKPSEIIEELDLQRPIYQECGRYGHFGHQGYPFTWETTDKAMNITRQFT